MTALHIIGWLLFTAFALFAVMAAASIWLLENAEDTEIND